MSARLVERPVSARRPRAARTLLVLAVVTQLVVLYAPRAPSTGGVWWVDKAVHLSVFAAVAWTGARAGVPLRPLVAVLLAHAVVSELVQHWLLPGRTGDPRDAVADAVGVGVGVLLAAVGAALAGRRGARGGRLGRWRTSSGDEAHPGGSTAGR